MNETDIEKILTKFAAHISDKEYQEYKKEIQGCLSYGRVLQVAHEGSSNLQPQELKHLNECCHCQKLFERLQFKIVAEIPRASLPAAAGTTEEPGNIPLETLKKSGFPSEASIVCERRPRGYAFRIESNIPLCYILTFLKDEEELYSIEISREIPDDDELVPSDAIVGWTGIRLWHKQ